MCVRSMEIQEKKLKRVKVNFIIDNPINLFLAFNYKAIKIVDK